MSKIMTQNEPHRKMRLYVHIPFCVQKCRYCDFLSGPCDEAKREKYLRALENEITHTGGKWGRLGENRTLESIFIGGGTPSVLTEKELSGIMKIIRENYQISPQAEITMECNPGTANREKFAYYRSLGMNRLSLGVQSFSDEELVLLGRIHTAEEAKGAFKDARDAGFDNINLDLMSALPGQSLQQWMNNLEEAVRLSPEHISAYSLILEEGTVLEKMMTLGELPPFPDEEDDRRMYHETENFLAACGYQRYEISNYARADRQSRHNIGYWRLDDYLGVGLGAASKMDHTRFSNTREMDQYLSLYIEKGENTKSLDTDHYEEYEPLSKRDEMGEFIFLGLRMTEGISAITFKERFGQEVTEVFENELSKHRSNGLLEWDGERYFLTRRGLDLSNYVMSDFV